jgi:hypothetical protein
MFQVEIFKCYKQMLKQIKFQINISELCTKLQATTNSSLAKRIISLEILVTDVIDQASASHMSENKGK